MSQGKTVKEFKKRVRANSSKFGGFKKSATDVPIVTKSGGTEEKLMKAESTKPSYNKPRKEGYGTKSKKDFKTNNDSRQFKKPSNSTGKPNGTSNPRNKKPDNKRPAKNLFFPDSIKTIPTDSHVAGNKSKEVSQAMLNPYYAAMDTHIKNAIDEVKKKCDGRTSFKVSSNRSKWTACHALTFDIKLFCLAKDKRTRDLLIYFVKGKNKNITIIVANSMFDSSAILFHYSGPDYNCPIAKYLPKMLESTETFLFNNDPVSEESEKTDSKD